MGEIIDLGIDRATATSEELQRAYAEYWNDWSRKREVQVAWLKGRIKQVGCKSMAEFVRVNKIPVTAGTVTNYFRGHNTMPIYMIKHMCYALRVTPNDLLTIMGYYDPQKQTLQSLSNEVSK